MIYWIPVLPVAQAPRLHRNDASILFKETCFIINSVVIPVASRRIYATDEQRNPGYKYLYDQSDDWVMKTPLKIFIIAGEVSGDVLGAKIMRELVGAYGIRPKCSVFGRIPYAPTKIEFAGIGGENMVEQGLKSIFPISDLAVMGFVEVIARARTITRRIRDTVAAIEKFQPDIVLTIDSPSFVKAVIRKVQSSKFKVQGRPSSCASRVTRYASRFYHIVAPQVWAWRPGRAKKYAEIFDRLYCFFDFEVPYFTKYGLETIPVGHPIADGLHSPQPMFCHSREGGNHSPQKEMLSCESRVTNHESRLNIALIPGSRMGEVKKLLPVMRRVAEMMNLSCSHGESHNSPLGGESASELASRLGEQSINDKTLSPTDADGTASTPPQGGSYQTEQRTGSRISSYKFYIPVVETTREYVERETRGWAVKPVIVPAPDRYDLFRKTDIAIAASGTVSVELAILHVPAVIVYRMNSLTFFLARIFVHIKWVSLVNILLKKMVYMELLGDPPSCFALRRDSEVARRAVTPENIIREVTKLESPAARKKMIAELSRADNMWMRDGVPAAKLIAESILKDQ